MDETDRKKQPKPELGRTSRQKEDLFFAKIPIGGSEEVDRTNSRFLLWRAVTRIYHARWAS